jgi:Domain of unknown function DUF11
MRLRRVTLLPVLLALGCVSLAQAAGPPTTVTLPHATPTPPPFHGAPTATVTADTTTVTVGADVTVTATVQNDGNFVANGVGVALSGYDPGLQVSYVSSTTGPVTAPVGGCNADVSTQVACVLGNIAIGSSQSITVELKALAPGAVTLSAAPTTRDPDASTTTGSLVVTVLAAPTPPTTTTAAPQVRLTAKLVESKTSTTPRPRFIALHVSASRATVVRFTLDAHARQVASWRRAVGAGATTVSLRLPASVPHGTKGTLRFQAGNARASTLAVSLG